MEPVRVKTLHLDYLILFLLSWVLLIDSINGYLKLSDSAWGMPLSQIYKTGLLILVLIRVHRNILIISLGATLFCILFLPSLVQLLQGVNVDLVEDALKIIKWITPILFYGYFVELFKKNDPRLFKKLFFFIKASYFIIVVNILSKFVGLGYSLYPNGVGSKGYFYAGNEISGVLVITYGIIAYRLWIKRNFFWFWTLFLFTANIGFVLGSKTALFGTILIALCMVIRPMEILASLKKMGNFLIVALIFIPIGIFVLIKQVMSSDVFQNRVLYFYEELDILTLILSSRNTYFENAVGIYITVYSFLEKLIGVGLSRYEILVTKTVEIEVIDILFTYGVVGMLLFLGLILLSYFPIKAKNKDYYPYIRLTKIGVAVLFIISTTAGHIFSSGMAGIFIGFIFATRYIKKTG